jgi:hypothetical protein
LDFDLYDTFAALALLLNGLDVLIIHGRFQVWAANPVGGASLPNSTGAGKVAAAFDAPRRSMRD